MKKKGFYITIAATIFSSAVFFSGCSSSEGLEGLSDVLTVAGEIAAATGHEKTAAGLSAAVSASTALETITPENEYYIGRAVAATLLTNYKVYNSPLREAYLNKICSALVINSENPELYNGYHVKILDSNEVNAFATSGGHIFITRGLLNCTNSEDSIAAALAHEIAHIQLQHSLKAIKASRWTTAGISATAAAVAIAKNDAELAGTMNDMVGDIVSDMVNNGYSQAQEFNADELALTIMADAGYNPYAILDMLKLLQNSNSISSGMFKTHPSPEKRIENISKQIQKVAIPKDTTSYRTARFSKNK